MPKTTLPVSRKDTDRPHLVTLTVSVRPDQSDALRAEARRRHRKLDASSLVREALDIAFPPGPQKRR